MYLEDAKWVLDILHYNRVSVSSTITYTQPQIKNNLLLQIQIRHQFDEHNNT